MSPERSVKDLFGPYIILLERAMGIEPPCEAWEASILPLYDARTREHNYSTCTSQKQVLGIALFPPRRASME